MDGAATRGRGLAQLGADADGIQGLYVEGKQRCEQSSVGRLPLLEIEQRLRLNHCHLLGVSGERVNVQLSLSGFEVNVAERLEVVDLQFREFHKHAPVSREALEVDMTLPIQIGTHFLDLKVGHITYPAA